MFYPFLSMWVIWDGMEFDDLGFAAGWIEHHGTL